MALLQKKFWDLQREEGVEVSSMRVADFRPGTVYRDDDPWIYPLDSPLEWRPSRGQS